MNIGKILVGGVIAVGSLPLFGGIFRLFAIIFIPCFCLFVLADCTSRIFTGEGIGHTLTDEEQIIEDKKEKIRLAEWSKNEIWGANVNRWMEFENGKFEKAVTKHAAPSDQTNVNNCRNGDFHACTKLRGKWRHIEYKLERDSN